MSTSQLNGSVSASHCKRLEMPLSDVENSNSDGDDDLQDAILGDCEDGPGSGPGSGSTSAHLSGSAQQGVGASPRSKTMMEKQAMKVLLAPNVFSPIDVSVKRQMSGLYAQVEAMKKKLRKESSRRVEAERHKFQVDEENMLIKIQFIHNLERVEKELLKYREEFQKIERRNDWLESMRETFEGEADHARNLAVQHMVSGRNKQILRAVVLWWRWISISEKIRKYRLERLQRRISVRVWRESMIRWVRFVDREKDKKMITLRARRFWERITMKHVMQSFALNAVQEKRKRFLLKKLMIQKGQFLLSVTFHAWHEFTTSERVKFLEVSNERLVTQVDTLRAKRLQTLQISMMRRSCLELFRAWHWHVQRSAKLARALKTFSSKMQLSSQRTAITAWKEYVRESRNADRKSELARTMFRQRLITTVFDEWKTFAMNKLREDNGQYVAVLEEAHISLRTRLSRFILAVKDREQKLFFSLWKKKSVDLLRARKVLYRTVRSTVLHSLVSRPFFDAWRAYVAEQQRSRELHKRATHFRLTKLKLFAIRSWQHFISDRNRTRLLSQKVVLDLQTKSLSRAFDSMGINVDDRKRAHEQEQTEQGQRHEREYQESEFRRQHCTSMLSDMDNLRGNLDSERKEWRDRYSDACRELERILQMERTAKDQLEEIKVQVVFGISDLKNPAYTDRFLLKKNVEDNYTKLLSLLDNLANVQSECERRYGRELQTLKRAVNAESSARDAVTRYSVSMHAGLRKLSDQCEETHRRMLDAHESETRMSRSKFQTLLQSVQEIEEMKESLVRENSEFEAWLKTDHQRYKNISDNESVVSGGTISGNQRASAKMLAETHSDAGSHSTIHGGTITKEKVGELLEEAHEMQAIREAEQRSQENMEAPIKDEVERMTEINENAQPTGEPPEAEYKVPQSTGSFTVAIPKKKSKKSKKSKSSSSSRAKGSNAEDDKGSFRVSDARKVVMDEEKKGKKTTVTSRSMDHQDAALAEATKTASMSSGVTFCVRPDRVPLIEEGDTRKLEIEILRLRRKFERQEKQLRSQFEDDVEVWRRRYEHALRVLIEMEDWKSQTEDHMSRVEVSHKAEVQDNHAMWQNKLDHESKVRHFYEEQLRSCEIKLHELEDNFARETQRLQGLVQYYESTFGIMKIKTSSELVKKKQRHDASAAAGVPSVSANLPSKN
eukprot:ANDGO_06081.mRNA.1 hypothetical protein